MTPWLFTHSVSVCIGLSIFSSVFHTCVQIGRTFLLQPFTAILCIMYRLH